MKKLVLGLAVLLGIAVFWATLPCDNQVFAQSGCCKERASVNHPWRATTKSLGECKADNQARDGDNVFKRSGLIWWDAGC